VFLNHGNPSSLFLYSFLCIVERFYTVDASFSELQELAYPRQMSGTDYEVLDCKGLILFTTSTRLNYGVGHDYLESQLILWNLQLECL
jgi:hypothetical protein